MVRRALTGMTRSPARQAYRAGRARVVPFVLPEVRPGTEDRSNGNDACPHKEAVFTVSDRVHAHGRSVLANGV